MKHIEISQSDFAPNIRDRLAEDDKGVYIVYGVFIAGTALNISRLYKGSFADIELRINNPQDPSPQDTTFLVPVPEFVVDAKDPQYAKYINLHFVESKDVESDEEMMRRFAEAFTSKMSSEAASQEEELQAANDAQMAAKAGGALHAVAQKLEDSLASISATAQAAAEEIEVRKHQDAKLGFNQPEPTDTSNVTDAVVKSETSDDSGTSTDAGVSDHD